MFKEALYSGSIGAIIGGGMGFVGGITKGDWRSQTAYGAVEATLDKPEKLERMKKLIDKKVKDNTYTMAEGAQMKETLDDMRDVAMQSRAIGLGKDDNVAKFQVYQMQNVNKGIMKDFQVREAQLKEGGNPDPKAVEIFERDAKQAKELSSIIADDYGKIWEEKKAVTKSPAVFEKRMKRYNKIADMIKNKADYETIQNEIEKLKESKIADQKAEAKVETKAETQPQAKKPETKQEAPTQKVAEEGRVLSDIGEVDITDLTPDQQKGYNFMEAQMEADKAELKNEGITPERKQQLEEKIAKNQATLDSVLQKSKEEKQEAPKPTEETKEKPDGVKVATDINPELKKNLKDLGYTKEEIDKMDKNQMADIIQNKEKAKSWRRRNKVDSSKKLTIDENGDVNFTPSKNKNYQHARS
jgi:predicted DCC family thiol-disulfide oxidoreductase YuxK